MEYFLAGITYILLKFVFYKDIPVSSVFAPILEDNTFNVIPFFVNTIFFSSILGVCVLAIFFVWHKICNKIKQS